MMITIVLCRYCKPSSLLDYHMHKRRSRTKGSKVKSISSHASETTLTRAPKRLFFPFSLFLEFNRSSTEKKPRLVTHLLRQENLNFTSCLLPPTSKGHRSLYPVGTILSHFFFGLSSSSELRGFSSGDIQEEWSIPQIFCFFCFRVYFPRVSAL